MAAGFDTTKPSARMKFRKPTLLPVAIGHHTPAVRTLFGLATGAARGVLRRTKRKTKRSVSGGVRKKARRTRTTQARAPKRTRRRSAKPAHMIKGSAAAKRHMASIRRKKKA